MTLILIIQSIILCASIVSTLMFAIKLTQFNKNDAEMHPIEWWTPSILWAIFYILTH